MNSSLYFDYAAATPLDERVLAAMQPYLTDYFYNPSATYNAARTLRAEMEAAREVVAHWLGARPSEIVFTAGGTEANNLAIHGVMRMHPEANMIISSIEHSALAAPAAEYDCRPARVDESGILDLEHFKSLVDDRTMLVSVMYANNEIGTIQPIRELSRVISDIRQQRKRDGNSLPLLLHSDACQAPNYLDIHVARLGVDLMSLNGSKIYGPKQTGALFVKGGTVLEPLIKGGGQERGLRSGTENLAGIIGFARALDLVQMDRHDEVRRMQSLQAAFMSALTMQLPQARINGSKTKRLPNNIHMTLEGMDNERLLIELDEQGIMAAAGSACSASHEEASPVLRALGLGEDEARASLRFSMGRQTSLQDVEATVQALAKIYNSQTASI